jgi:hypothetical protein
VAKPNELPVNVPEVVVIEDVIVDVDFVFDKLRVREYVVLALRPVIVKTLFDKLEDAPPGNPVNE